MIRRARFMVLALGALAFAVATPAARRAEACGNAIIFATDENVRAVKAAEEKLNDGDPTEAAASIEKRVFGPRPADWLNAEVSFNGVSKTAALGNRTLRIIALACVRLDGAIGPWGNAKPQQRKANVQWATSTSLQAIAATKPTDAVGKADYAEALAKTSGSEAKKRLEDLAAKDVLATPYAYAALAALRGSSGDAKGRDEALARCRTMAAKKSICEPPAPKPNG